MNLSCADEALGVFSSVVGVAVPVAEAFGPAVLVVVLVGSGLPEVG